MTLVAEFKECLSKVSYWRAGWDFPDNPAEQRAQEAHMGHKALARAREIWHGYPEHHDALRAAFREAGPLATLDEITREDRT